MGRVQEDMPPVVYVGADDWATLVLVDEVFD